MSLIKRFQDDADEVSQKAAIAAEIRDDTERFTALRSVFESCGHLANSYACPTTVVRLLVSEAADEYQSARRHVPGRQFERSM